MNLRIPFIIVLVAAITGAICTMLMAKVILSSILEDASEIAIIFAGMYNILAIISTIAKLITPFISWVLCAGAFYAISIPLKGDGSFKRVFEFVGYGFIPTILASVIGLATVLIVSPAIEFSFGAPQLMQQTMMQHLFKYGPAMVISGIIQLLLVLWGVIIWIFGVKHARNLEMEHAILTVLGIPAAFFLIWVIAMIYAIAAGLVGGI